MQASHPDLPLPRPVATLRRNVDQPKRVIDFRQILAPECTRTGVGAHSKKAALETASGLLAARFPAMDSRRLLEGLLDRERLGSTGLGEGVAIPHCRFAQCQRPVACCLKTADALDFDAPDDMAVDLLFVLAVPLHGQRAHLEILGALARAFDAPGSLAALRQAQTHQALYEGVQETLAATQQE